MAEWIEEGQPAPDFSAVNQNGKTVSLGQLKGSPVVLYFYPKDDTPGCTREACAFRDAQKELHRLGAVLLGMSPDDQDSHQKFQEKFSLNFDLLSDPEHKIAESFGAWREKNNYGKVSMGIARSTFLMGADGRVAKVWKKVSVDGHDQQVLKALSSLTSARPQGKVKTTGSAQP
jgi:peroxiredoxin Q/BCP